MWDCRQVARGVGVGVRANSIIGACSVVTLVSLEHVHAGRETVSSFRDV
jgi:hypothetical protein